MLSFISRDGVVSPQDTPKTQPLSSPLYRSDASLSGQISRDYTIWTASKVSEIRDDMKVSDLVFLMNCAHNVICIPPDLLGDPVGVFYLSFDNHPRKT